MTPAHSPHFPDCFYRVTVKGLYVKDGKAIFTHDFTSPHHPEGELELPGGGLDFGEDMKDALRREVKEEMGLTVTDISDGPVFSWTALHEAGRGMEWFYACVIVFRFHVKDLSEFTPTEECREVFFLSKKEMQERKGEMADQILPLVDAFNPEDFK